jgi:hypothetical protein
MSATKPSTESREFPGPWVRVRGRLTREGVATFSPCIRTFKGPAEHRHKSPVVDIARAGLSREPAVPTAAPPSATAPAPSAGEMVARDQVVVPRPDDQIPRVETPAYEIRFESADGTVLEVAPTSPRFYARDAAWAGFGGRLPYHPKTERVVLRFGSRELGVMKVPRTLPQFDLVAPTSAAKIDLAGILHLAWRQDVADKKANKAHPLTYYVRYLHDESEGLRPGVNLSTGTFDLDLRGLPGGKSCRVQVLATNGYRTAFVETPSFELPQPGPTVMLGDPEGPELFAQGYSPNHGPLIGEAIAWLVDGRQRATGGSFDARAIGEGDHEITVIIRDRDGRDARQELGRYDGLTGRLRSSRRGL